MTAVLVTFLLFACLAQARAIHHAHSRGYLLAVQLNRALERTPMRGAGWALVVEGKRRDVNPFLIAAIAGKESSYGAAACRSNRWNVWGLASCSRSWRVPSFGSWREAVRFFAGWLRTRFPRADSPYDLHGYCVTSWGEECPSWAGDVAWRMRALGSPSTSARYPA